MNLSEVMSEYMKGLESHIKATHLLKRDRVNNLYYDTVNVVEKSLLENVLTFTRYNQCRAADILGLNRETVRKMLKRHGMWSNTRVRYQEEWNGRE